MNKLSSILTLLLLLPLSEGWAVDQWIQKANFGGAARHRCTAFSIGNKGYIGGGHINSAQTITHEDYWQYDPGSDSWTQIADFGGGQRYHSVSFSIGEFGYVGLGEDHDDNYHNDFYRYVPQLNIWQPIANFPGNPRRAAAGFVIDGFGYVGTGQSDFGYEEDFYKYDPLANDWYPIADFLGEARSAAVAFAHNGKGYLGTGHIWGDHTKDFFEYDPQSDTWSQKADVGPTFRQDATGFVLNGYGYIGTGNDVDGNLNYKDFWRYDFDTDQWLQIADFCGEGRRYMVSFIIGNHAYAGTGTDGTNLRDFWMFDPLLSNQNMEPGLSVTPFPNPSNDQITFDLGINEVEIKLFTLDGKIVYTNSSVSGKVVFSKADYNLGQYGYSIATASGSTSTGVIFFQ
jgi:N-acetylneuraminic acid mutarotase